MISADMGGAAADVAAAVDAIATSTKSARLIILATTAAAGAPMGQKATSISHFACTSSRH